MKRSAIFTGLIVLVAMQVVGQSVVWDLVWESGVRDVRVMSALWCAWTLVQIALAIPVGIHLARWGVARFAPPRVSERLPDAWVRRANGSARDARPVPTPRSAMLSA